jgi:hypothetical protein
MVTPHLPEGTLSARQFRDGLGFRASFWEEVQQLRESCHRRLKSGFDKPGDVHLATMEVTKC